MRELWIANINSADARSLADNWDSYLSNVGCVIYIQAVYDRMIISWKTSTPSTIHHILDFVDDAFDDVFINFFKLERAIKNLKDDHAVIVDYDDGDVGIRAL